MTGRQILGAVLISLPFVAIVVWAQVRERAGWVMVGCFAAAFAVAAAIGIGFELLGVH